MAEHRHNLRSRKSLAGDATAPAETTAPAPAAFPSPFPSSDDKQLAPANDPHAKEEELEFGGAVGTFAMMTGFPALFYYLYACLFFHDGERRPLSAPCGES